jgi:hypothetical protein
VAADKLVVYTPEAVVRYHVPADRMIKAYYQKRETVAQTSAPAGRRLRAHS